MYKNKKIAVVVPAYNEEKLIRKTILTIPKYVDKIIIIDDNSVDNTLQIVKNLFKKNPSKIIIFHHKKNIGVGAAIKTGYRKAININVDIVAVMAGDAQMDPFLLHNLLDPIIDEKSDYTKGNRLTHKEKIKMPKFRAFGNGLLTFLTKISSGYWSIIDPQNGYTAISKKALKSIDINDIFDGYGYPNDLLVKLNLANLRVKDVEMPPIYESEQSNIKITSYSAKLIKILIKGFFKRIWGQYGGVNFHPLFFFYMLGFLLFPIGIFMSVYIVIGRILFGSYSIGTVILTTLLIILGFQSLIFAMMFDMQSKNSYK